MTRNVHVSLLGWPLIALWGLLGTIVGITGRFVVMVLGIVFILVGMIISLTGIGATIGIPMAIVSVLIFLKGIF